MSCKRCGKKLAYVGAIFCGAACSARWEGGDRNEPSLSQLLWDLIRTINPGADGPLRDEVARAIDAVQGTREVIRKMREDLELASGRRKT